MSSPARSDPNALRALPQRVLRDLLQVGDRERFGATALAWLLDVTGEHGLRDAFVHRLSELLALHEEDALALALQADVLPLSTELVTRDGHTDVVLSVASTPKLALVDAGCDVARAAADYQAAEVSVIAVSHPGGGPVRETEGVPVWRWVDDLVPLLGRLAAGPFGDFVRQLVATAATDRR